MTTANLMKVSSVKGNGFTSQAEASKKLQDENAEAVKLFSVMMNRSMQMTNSIVDDASSNTKFSKTDNVSTAAESYERYSYKENQINEAKEQTITEKLEESTETLEQAEKEVVNTIVEEYDVTEEEIQNLLENMGLSVLDLLNPQNLVSFIAQLTDAPSGEALLLDESFLNLMQTLDGMTEGLIKELDVDMEGLQALIDEMDVVSADTEMDVVSADTEISAMFQNTLEATVEQMQTVEETAKAAGKNVDVEAEEQVVENKTENTVQTEEETAKAAGKNVDVEAEEQVVENKTENTVQTEESEITVNQSTKEDSLFSNNQNSDADSLWNQQTDSNENIVINQTNVNVNQVTDMPQTQFSSYMSADTMQIMEQIVQQVRVNVLPETTSMEMQLNPENLGKVYVHISSEKGVVNAQFHATNEVVKEALETQLATLRESLNQAGVKVDAIEVTIESHEFERNLEQNQKHSEENPELQDSKTNKRRNISMDSLDELSGIMTEEETLVAQIMKDNGNSVDFTA